MSESKFLRHAACPDCGSSDGLSVYDDGHTHCFSCGKTTQPKKAEPIAVPDIVWPIAMITTASAPWKEYYRGIPGRVLDQYGVQIQDDLTVFNYRNVQGDVVAQKTRNADKSKVAWRGKPKEVAGFGAHLASPKKHDAIAICEGEFDAPSIFHATSGKVVGISVPSGAQSAANFVKKNLDFFNQFKVVYIATDMDEPGKAAAAALVHLFEAGQVRRCIFTRKDANEELQELGSQALKDAVWGAKELRPDGIRSSSTYQGVALQPPDRSVVPCAFGYWNDKTQGFWDNQLILLIAGSGIGKTTFARSLAIGDMERGIKVGWIGLEETAEEAIYRFVGMCAGVQLHARRNYIGLTQDQLDAISDADKFVTSGGRLELFDHFGSLDEETILNRMAYMVRSLGCKHIYLDHLTIIGSGLAQDTRHLDALVTKIRSFIAATKCTVFAISHLNRGSSQVRNMEDGGVPELHDIRGSHSIVQLSDTIWALGRKRGTNRTHSYCLKNRMTGRQGYAGSFEFNEATQQLTQLWDDPTNNPF